MKNVISMLNDNTQVTIISSIDEICTSCPNGARGTCESENKVNRYDQLVLELCGIQSGETMLWTELVKKLQKCDLNLRIIYEYDLQ